MVRSGPTAPTETMPGQEPGTSVTPGVSPSSLPEAAMTIVPADRACATAAAKAVLHEVASPPRLMFTTRAPESTAKPSAARMSSSSAPQSSTSVMTRRSSSETSQLTPATPTPSSPFAPMMPATCVPWPSSGPQPRLFVPSGRSLRTPPTNACWLRRFGARSGWRPSTPLSMTATSTSFEPVVVSQASSTPLTWCDHCCS